MSASNPSGTGIVEARCVLQEGWKISDRPDRQYYRHFLVECPIVLVLILDSYETLLIITPQPALLRTGATPETKTLQSCGVFRESLDPPRL